MDDLSTSLSEMGCGFTGLADAAEQAAKSIEEFSAEMWRHVQERLDRLTPELRDEFEQRHSFGEYAIDLLIELENP